MAIQHRINYGIRFIQTDQFDDKIIMSGFYHRNSIERYATTTGCWNVKYKALD